MERAPRVKKYICHDGRLSGWLGHCGEEVQSNWTQRHRFMATLGYHLKSDPDAAEWKLGFFLAFSHFLFSFSAERPLPV